MSAHSILVVLCIVCLAGLLGNVVLMQERRELRENIARPPEERAVQADAEIVQLRETLREETSLLQAAQTAIVAAEKALPRIEGEELRSMGYVEQLGREAAEMLPQLIEAATLMKRGGFSKLPESEQTRIGAKVMAWVNRVGALGDLEEDTPKIALFHATTLRERLHLDEASAEAVRRQAEREFGQLKAQGLARPDRPERDREEWYERRKRALDEAAQRIEALIPANRREPHAVGQSLHLGTGLRASSQIRPDGHGSVSMRLDLPGFEQ